MQEIVQLIGSDALPEREQLTLEVARLVREFFLQQNAYHEVDAYSDLNKSYRILKTILHFNDKANSALKSGMSVKEIIATKARNKISDAKFDKDYNKILDSVMKEIDSELVKR